MSQRWPLAAASLARFRCVAGSYVSPPVKGRLLSCVLPVAFGEPRVVCVSASVAGFRPRGSGSSLCAVPFVYGVREISLILEFAELVLLSEIAISRGPLINDRASDAFA